MGRRKLITVLDKMIVQDLLKTLLAVLVVIVVIIVSRQFIRVLDKAIAGQVSNETLLSISGLENDHCQCGIFACRVIYGGIDGSGQNVPGSGNVGSCFGGRRFAERSIGLYF